LGPCSQSPGLPGLPALGFVWYGGPQEEEVVESSLIDEVEAGFVTVHEAQGRLGCQRGEGGGHAVAAVSLGLGGDFIIEDAGFQGPGTTKAPEGGGHFLDHPQFDAVGRIEAGEVLVQEGLKGFGGFIAKQNALGEEAVAERILGGALFAFGGDGAARAGSVGTGSERAL
jgi:hypothetical protein